jgi:hypothetical protein
MDSLTLASRKRRLKVPRKALYFCLLGAGAILWSMMRSRMPSLPSDSIEFRGEQFKLTKAYSDYEDYKDDPNNLAPSENARVERAVTQAKVSPGSLTRTEMVREVFGLQFPGYGMTQFSEKAQPDGTSLAAFSVEIPRAHKDRVLVFRGRGDVYSLIDDFVFSSADRIMRVRREAGQLVYSNLEGKQVLDRPFPGE